MQSHWPATKPASNGTINRPQVTAAPRMTWTLRSWQHVQDNKMTWRDIFTTFHTSIDLHGMPDYLLDVRPERVDELMPPGVCFNAERGVWVYSREKHEELIHSRAAMDYFEAHLNWYDKELATDQEQRGRRGLVMLQQLKAEVAALEAQSSPAKASSASLLRQAVHTAQVKREAISHGVVVKAEPSASPTESAQLITPPASSDDGMGT